jgi:hypothetical protein
MAIYKNIRMTGDFRRNDCGKDSVGSVFTYIVPPGIYESDKSQKDADDQALEDIKLNGQKFANEFGTCSVVPTKTQTFTNISQQRTFTKNDCPNGVGSSYVYKVAAGMYTAPTQAEADQMATDEINKKGQDEANKYGRCIIDADKKKLFRTIKVYDDGSIE